MEVIGNPVDQFMTKAAKCLFVHVAQRRRKIGFGEFGFAHGAVSYRVEGLVPRLPPWKIATGAPAPGNRTRGAVLDQRTSVYTGRSFLLALDTFVEIAIIRRLLAEMIVAFRFSTH